MPVAAATQGPHQQIGLDAEGDVRMFRNDPKAVSEFIDRWSQKKLAVGSEFFQQDTGEWTSTDPTPPAAQGAGTQSMPPTASNTKAEIVAWLLTKGVSLTQTALMALTKAELLDLVDDLTN